MIITEESKVKLNYNNNREYFQKLGYETSGKTEIFVKVEDLNKGSHAFVKIK